MATKKNARKPLDFQVAIKRHEPIPFRLSVVDEDGEPTGEVEEYEFTPQKNSLMVMPMLDGDGGENETIKAVFDWLGAGLPEEQSDRLKDRLRDPADPLDLDTLGNVIESLVEATGGRPTT